MPLAKMPLAKMPLQEAIDREAIRNCLHHLSRAVDRRDFDLLAKCYWPEAIEEHGAFNGAIADFLVWLDVRTRDWDRTMFSLSQIIIDLDGDRAAVETYFNGYRKRPKPEGGWFDEFVSGRYVDKMTKRQDEWRIEHRTVVFEWFRQLPDSMDFAGSPFGAAQRGAHKPADPLYALLKDLVV
jgi:hypothetical protein